MALVFRERQALSLVVGVSQSHRKEVWQSSAWRGDLPRWRPHRELRIAARPPSATAQIQHVVTLAKKSSRSQRPWPHDSSAERLRGPRGPNRGA